MPFPYEEFDLSGVRTYPLADRASKVSAGDFATPYRKGGGVAALVAGLPNMLGGSDFKAVVQAIVGRARAAAASSGASARTSSRPACRPS